MIFTYFFISLVLHIKICVSHKGFIDRASGSVTRSFKQSVVICASMIMTPCWIGY